MKIFKTKLWRGLSAVFITLTTLAVLLTSLCAQWAGNINAVLGVKSTSSSSASTDDTDAEYYASEFGKGETALNKMIEASRANEIQTLEEGSVLLKNKNGALPLKDNERGVTLLGKASTDPVWRCAAGGPTINSSNAVTLSSALESAGFSINKTVLDATASNGASRNANTGDIGEVPVGFYDAYTSSYASSYNDVAIIVFGRYAGEGNDLFQSGDADGMNQLALHPREKSILEHAANAKKNGSIKKIVVLINSVFAMELDWLNDESYGIDAALNIGTPGTYGFEGVVNLLTGKADPSGHLVDTYAANSLSSAAVQNSGDISYSNSNDISAQCGTKEGFFKYIVEAEGIYVGYKYYETRYNDQVLGANNATSSAGVYASKNNSWNYADEMVYTFGCGLTYANFTQTLKSVTWDKDSHTVTAVVNVKNNGSDNYDGASKCAVQLYVQLPYVSGNAQKSAIQIIGFGKTQALRANEEEDVTITVDDYLFATYDENAINGADKSKMGCYVFDEGDYYFAIGNDSHDALNNVLSSKYGDSVANKLTDAEGNVVEGNADNAICVKLDQTDDVTYATSRETGVVVCNQMQDINVNYFYDNDVVTYLTRDDWNTFPKRYDDIAATAEMIKQLKGNDYVKPDDAPAYSSITMGADNGINFIDMKDVEYDDPKWELFLDQFTLAEMCSQIGDSLGVAAVTSVNKPATSAHDGPYGSQSAYFNGQIAISHCGAPVAAATFNTELLESRGRFLAEDFYFAGTDGAWSPGANLHRTPFSGRNFEYYSEDSIISYIDLEYQSKAMLDKGLAVMPKHFAGNDQETNRYGMSKFMTEQAYRQGALKAFEGALSDGGVLGTMTSYNRIGCVYSGAHATVNVILRGEWGFKGATISDASNEKAWITLKESLVAGTDIYCLDSGRSSELQKYLATSKDGYVLSALRTATKRSMYMYLHCYAINGLTSETVVEVEGLAWWQYAEYAICAVLALAALGSVTMYVLSEIKERKNISEVIIND